MLLHLAGVALAVTAVCPSASAASWPTADLIVPVLTSAIVINLGLYLFSTVPVSIWSAREIAFILLAGAVLAGRTLAGPALRNAVCCRFSASSAWAT